MDFVNKKLVTIVAESALEKRLLTSLHDAGIKGYTVSSVHGAGTRNQRVGDLQGGNVKIECGSVRITWMPFSARSPPTSSHTTPVSRG